MKKVVALAMVCALLSTGFAFAQTAAPAEYTVTLLENPTTGYTWTFAVSDEAILAITDNDYTADANADQVAGLGGTHSWTLTAKAAGDANVVFTLGQAWEGGEQSATLTYQFHADADLQLTLTQITGIPELYSPDQTAVLLIENPTTGYEWQYTATQEGILTPVKDEYLDSTDADELRFGAGGTHLWTFAGAAEGDVTLTFTYSRSWEEGVAPEATVTYAYHVGSDLRVTCTSVDGDYAQYDALLSCDN